MGSQKVEHNLVTEHTHIHTQIYNQESLENFSLI